MQFPQGNNELKRSPKLPRRSRCNCCNRGPVDWLTVTAYALAVLLAALLAAGVFLAVFAALST